MKNAIVFDIIPDMGLFKKHSNPELQGRVSGADGSPTHEDRKDEITQAVFGFGNELKAGRQDIFGGTGNVSIEREAERTLIQQKGLDDLVERENIFPEEDLTKRGLPPCKRVRKEG